MHFKILFIYFWLWWVSVAALRLSLVAASGGYSLAVVPGSLTAVAPLVVEHGLEGTVAHGLSCPDARGIFPDQGSNSFVTSGPPRKSLVLLLNTKFPTTLLSRGLMNYHFLKLK